MKVPTLSPSNRGNDVVTITTTSTCATVWARDDQRLDQDRCRNLRLPELALDEDDRHLADAVAAPLGLVEHLDQEGVAVGDHAAERQPCERLAAPAPVAAGAIAWRELRDRADVLVREGAEEDAVQRPVHHADALEVARTDHHVVLRGGGRERREVLRVVREVGVHLADQIDVSLCHGTLQAVDVRAPQAAGTGAMHHLEASWELHREPIGDLPGTIGRGVVDDHHPEALVREHAADQGGQVLAFVVGRDDDQDARERHDR
jgi:hypothetical protein